MGSLTIERYPNVSLNMVPFPFLPVVKVDLRRSVRSYLSGKEELTNQRALEILRDVKWKSDVKAFLLKPFILIPAGSALVTPSLAIPAVGIIDILFRVICIIGAAMIGVGIDALSNQYGSYFTAQSEKAAEYISTLEKNPSMKVELSK